MEGPKVDPAALLIAVIAVGVQALNEEGAWEPVNSGISLLVLVLVSCYLWPEPGTRGRYIVGFSVGVAFILGIGLAWPAQGLLGISPDAATYVGFAAAVVLVGLGMWQRSWITLQLSRLAASLGLRRPVVPAVSGEAKLAETDTTHGTAAPGE
jgi:hypothetical protein